MDITIVVNNNSWFEPFAWKIMGELLRLRHNPILVYEASHILHGDICFLLSVEEIVQREILNRNTHNIVIHASALPQGKGWSPLTWQILEGKNDIPMTLFEATDKVDAGDIYLQRTLHLDGSELLDEIHEKEGKLIVEMALEFVAHPPVDTYKESGYQLSEY